MGCVLIMKYYNRLYFFLLVRSDLNIISIQLITKIYSMLELNMASQNNNKNQTYKTQNQAMGNCVSHKSNSQRSKQYLNNSNQHFQQKYRIQFYSSDKDQVQFYKNADNLHFLKLFSKSLYYVIGKLKRQQSQFDNGNSKQKYQTILNKVFELKQSLTSLSQKRTSKQNKLEKLQQTQEKYQSYLVKSKKQDSSFLNQSKMQYSIHLKRNRQYFQGGLHNLGNTCYMNSALQCLHKSKYFSKKIISKANQIKSKLKGQSEFELTAAYEQFLQEMCTKYAYAPWKIKQIMGKKYDIFKYNYQNDATQFFNCFIKTIQQELNQTTKNQPKEIDHYSQQSIQIYKNIKYNQQTYQNSIIQETFSGRYKVVFSSSDPRCKHTYTNFQKFNVHILQLTYNNQKKVTLEQCLILFNQTEVLKENNRTTCDICKDETFNLKKMEIYQTNKIFVVNFKRFLNHHKNQTAVQAPQILDLTNFVTESERPKYAGKRYKLYAAIIHSGNLMGGHYYAYCYNYKTKKWMEYNDSHVQLLDFKKVDFRQAMTLFYELQQKEGTATNKSSKTILLKPVQICQIDRPQVDSAIERRQMQGNGKIILSVMNWLIRCIQFKQLFFERVQLLNNYKIQIPESIKLLQQAITSITIDTNYLRYLLDLKKQILVPNYEKGLGQLPNLIISLLKNIDDLLIFKLQGSQRQKNIKPNLMKLIKQRKVQRELTEINFKKIIKFNCYHQIQQNRYKNFQKIFFARQFQKQYQNIVKLFLKYWNKIQYKSSITQKCERSGQTRYNIKYQMTSASPVLMLEIQERQKVQSQVNIPQQLETKYLFSEQQYKKHYESCYKISAVIQRREIPENYQYCMFYYDFQRELWYNGSDQNVNQVSNKIPVFKNVHFLIYEQIVKIKQK